MVMALPPVASLQLEMGETGRANHPFPANGLRTELKLPIFPPAGEIAIAPLLHPQRPHHAHHGFRQKRAHMLYMEL
jgi:hypothetical protein